MTEIDQPNKQRRSLPMIAALATGFLLRLAWAHHVRHQPLFGDGILYEYFARGVLDGHYPEEALNFRSMLPPGYPGFVALVWTVAGRGNDYALRVAQCILATAAIWLIARMASKMFNRRVGIATAWVLALYPFGIFYTATVMSEPLYMFLFALNLSLLFDLREQPNSARAVAVGVVAGLGALTRPQHLLFVAVSLAWLFFTSRTKEPRLRSRLAPLLIAALSCGAVVLPWTIRNYAHYHELVGISDNGTDVLWWGNNPLASRAYLANDPDEFDRITAQIWGAEGERVLRRNGRTLAQKKADVTAIVVAYVKQHPGEWLTVEAKKLVAFWRPWLGGHNSRAQSAVSMLTYGPLLLFGLPFLVWQARRRSPIAAESQLLVIVCLMNTAIAVVFVSLSRYRFPVIDPYLAVYACGAADAAVRRWRSR
jgi:4-amino-4-deoxy-L-arabinose transferase-like glycosyltransferase